MSLLTTKNSTDITQQTLDICLSRIVILHAYIDIIRITENLYIFYNYQYLHLDTLLINSIPLSIPPPMPGNFSFQSVYVKWYFIKCFLVEVDNVYV